MPKAAIFRLSLYLRQLQWLRTQGRQTVSSRNLGAAVNSSGAQVRKDLAYFGQFGRPGVGYRIDDLVVELRKILRTDQTWNVAVLGAGNLGRALSAYKGFRDQGFNIVSLFDNDPQKIGRRVGGLTVQPLEELALAVHDLLIRIAVLCVPAAAAQGVAEAAVRAGIRGILNFAPVTLDLPNDVVHASVDLAIRLEMLSFELGSGGP